MYLCGIYVLHHIFITFIFIGLHFVISFAMIYTTEQTKTRRFCSCTM